MNVCKIYISNVMSSISMGYLTLIILATLYVHARLCLAQVDISSVMLAQALVGQQTGGGMTQSVPNLLQTAGNMQAMMAAIESTDADVLAKMTLGRDYKKIMEQMKTGNRDKSNSLPNPEAGFSDTFNSSASFNPKLLLESALKNGGNGSNMSQHEFIKLMTQQESNQHKQFLTTDESKSKNRGSSNKKNKGHKVHSGEQTAKSRSASNMSELGSLMDDELKDDDKLKGFDGSSSKHQYVDLIEKDDGSYEVALRKSSSERPKQNLNKKSKSNDDEDDDSDENKVNKSTRSKSKKSKHSSKSKSDDDDKSKKSKRRRNDKKKKSKKHKKRDRKHSSDNDSRSKSNESKRDGANALSRTTTANPLAIFNQPAGYPNPFPYSLGERNLKLERDGSQLPRKNLVINLLMTLMEELLKADGGQAKENGVSFLYKGRQKIAKKLSNKNRIHKQQTSRRRQTARNAATRLAHNGNIHYLDARESNFKPPSTVAIENVADAATPEDDKVDTEPIVSNDENDFANDSTDSTSPGRLVSVSHGWMAPRGNSSQRVTNVTNLRQCVDECMQQAECQSADHNQEAGTCSLHTNDVILCSTLVKQTNMTHIRKEPCESRLNSSTSPGFVILGAQLSNGTDQPQTNDFKTCVETCRSPSSSSPSPSGNCTAVNYDIVSRECRHFHQNNLCATPTNTADLFNAKTSVISVLLCH